MFLAYIDESGHSKETEFFSLVGSVADWDVWRQFNARWKEVLETNRAPYLHMREFAHRRGAFENWDEPRRRRLLDGCLAAMEAFPISHIGAAMRVADFNRLSARKQYRVIDPTFPCFQKVLRGIRILASDSAVRQADVVYSRQDEFGHVIRKLYAHLKKGHFERQFMGALEFQDMRSVPGLQLADLVAYELRHYYHLRAHRPDLQTRYPFKRIIAHQKRVDAAFFEFMPGWLLELHIAGIAREAQNVFWSDPDLWWPMLKATIPDAVEYDGRLWALASTRSG